MIVNTVQYMSHECNISNTTYLAPMHIILSHTVEPPNNGHGGDEHFVHCSEVLPLSTIIISLVCESQCIYIYRLLHNIYTYITCNMYMYIVHCHNMYVQL